MVLLIRQGVQPSGEEWRGIRMRYPDGSTVKLGDLVWWDEGNSVGRIIDIHETKEQCANWGVEEPGVAICYDGAGMGGLFVGCPQRAFPEEGIRRLTTEEEGEVDGVRQAAQSFSPEKADDATTGLFRKQRNSREYWNVVLYRNRQALQVIEVDPLSLSCREIPLKESGLFYDLK